MTIRRTRMISVLLSLAVAAVGLTAALTRGFTVWNRNQPAVPVSPGVYDGTGNELVSGKVYPLSSSMVFTSPSSESPLAENGVTLQATVKPDTADDKALDWTVTFVNPASTWATGKAVSDYVSVTPTSNGADTATVTCNEAFGEQIKITVTSRSNPNAKAECVVDFAKRVEGFTGNVDGSEIHPGTYCTLGFDIDTPDGLQHSFFLTPIYSVYTLDIDYTWSATLSLSSYLLAKAETAGLTVHADHTMAVGNTLDFGADLFEDFFFSTTSSNAVNRNKLVTVFAQMEAGLTPVFDLTVTFSGGEISSDLSFYLFVDPDSISVLVETVELNHNTLTF